MLEARRSTAGSTSWASSLGAGPGQVSIDPNGNLAQKVEGTDTWVYTWNAENQLTKVEKNGAEVGRFAYDPLGRRLEQIGAGVTTNYSYAGGNVVRETRGGSSLRYVHGAGIDEVLAADDGTAFTYFHADGLGSIVKVTNGVGAVTLARQYDAWGNLEVGATERGSAFTGREWDPDTGLYYYSSDTTTRRAGCFWARIRRDLMAEPTSTHMWAAIQSI